VRNVARIVPGTAAVFLAIMAILINSPALFYMGTAMFATIGACRLQAWLSVRGLRVERVAPPAVNVGERVNVDIIVWSERRLKRPLVTVNDQLPKRLVLRDRTPSFPIAPSFDQPIHTRYSFVPLRRGLYRWSTIEVIGTDALGLVAMGRVYRTDTADLTVYPAPIPVSLALRPAGGTGVTESESGRYRGAGIEPRGVREYVPGDPQRYVHWASSARTGRLMVKEFEAGASLQAYFCLQRELGSDVGTDANTTFEAMCGHTAYLADQFLRQGAGVGFPGLEDLRQAEFQTDRRRQQIDALLARIEADQNQTLSQSIEQALAGIPDGGTIYVLLSKLDAGLPALIRREARFGWSCLVYDPADYPSKKSIVPNQRATDSPYLHQLRDTGAEVVIMPKVERIG